MDLEIIHPISFYDNKILQSADIGSAELYPILQEIQHMNTKGQNHKAYIEDILRDFVINNISGLSNTFIIKLLEDNIKADEVAYLVDFYSDFNIKDYLLTTISKTVLGTKDPESICNLIQSNIIFILNQFIQFYSMYKLVYTNEGVNLYEFLCRETYGEKPNKDMLLQNKYVFCNSILSSMLEIMIPHIKECCDALKTAIINIKSLSKGGQ